MLDAYKELKPVIYGKNGIKFLELRTEGPGGICFLMHWHERMELLRVVSGEMLLHVGGEQVCVCAGQVAVISPCTMHYGLAGKSGVMYYTIMFDVEKFHNATMASEHYLLPVSRHRIGFQPVTDHLEVVVAVDRLVEALLQKESCALMAVGIVYEIMGTLCQYCLGKEKVQQRVDKGFNQVLEYIENHYRERISAKDISSHFGYNEAYFCRRFKAITGFTVMRYIQILRLEYAQQLLKHTEDAVEVVAWKCGFADTGYFSNCFRKSMGCTPSQFRRRTCGSDFDL